MIPLILASQSPARRRLLKRLGYRFTVRPAHVDEAAVAKRILEPRKLVVELARLKARHVSKSKPQAIVIGSDQVLVFGGKVFGKPHTAEKATRQLMLFSGQEVQLLTAVCVRDPSGRERSFVDQVCMTFRKLTRAEAKAYVALDQPLQCAGSFKFERHGIGLFASVRTTDPSSIEGLPLLKLQTILRDYYPAPSVRN